MHQEKNLKKVEGIGNKIAQRIIRVINSGFETIKTDRHVTLKMDDGT